MPYEVLVHLCGGTELEGLTTLRVSPGEISEVFLAARRKGAAVGGKDLCTEEMECARVDLPSFKSGAIESVGGKQGRGIRGLPEQVDAGRRGET